METFRVHMLFRWQMENDKCTVYHNTKQTTMMYHKEG